MTTRILQVLMRVALLVALVASTVLYIEYADGSPSFCGSGGGCAAVKASAFSHVGGVGLPTIGLAGFAGLFLGALLVSNRGHARLLSALLGLSALVAVALIGTQLFVLKTICPWCMVVDVSAIVAFVAALVASRREPDVEPWPLRFAWLVASAVAIGGPWSWAGAPVATVELPPALAALQRDGVKDVILFTDFQCPYCRKLHSALHARLATHPEKVTLRRFMAPLPFHKAAEPAARAYVCTPEPAREAMADRLYGEDYTAILGDESRPSEVAQTVLREALVGMADKAGLDKDAFAKCLDAEATKRQVADEFELYKSLQLPGLPTTFIDDKRIVGADLNALEQTLGGRDLRTMFALLALVFVCAAGLSLYRPTTDASEAPLSREAPSLREGTVNSDAKAEDEAGAA
jgi:uncharacterized membrane protein